ncbi:MAG TPA: response regulator transcription factor [Pseudonocardia sp.]|jgi:DNA-binding NarL/FixJ family response regulator|uniref:response regulator transcription factor n=1 Tax=Pseudonocardia sp. TaxID=60912 RepID=UPI002B4B073A|nr:response regulator transcription factor [Pseudonocardia sp.]HLU56605.1 response regulator transcription factor [Pseudonocardia sp.]
MNAHASAVLVASARALPRLVAAVESGGVDVAAGTEPGGALAAVTEHRPEVVVVDLDGAAALEVVAELVSAVPQVPLLTLCAEADHGVALAAVRAGATSHLTGPVAAGELAGAVRRTAAGEVVFSPGLADVLLEEFGRPAAERERPLTERESDVVRLVVEGLTARQIATRLVLSPRTVENHVQNVLRKLHLHSRAALVRYAIERGLA